MEIQFQSARVAGSCRVPAIAGRYFSGQQQTTRFNERTLELHFFPEQDQPSGSFAYRVDVVAHGEIAYARRWLWSSEDAHRIEFADGHKSLEDRQGGSGGSLTLAQTGTGAVDYANVSKSCDRRMRPEECRTP